MIFEAVIYLAMQTEPTGDFRPTRKVDPFALCSCKPVDAVSLVKFSGIASDAEMTLSEDPMTANARQATIFRVLKGKSADVLDLTKVWHVTNPAKCGISFDYGKRYDVVAVKKDGALETDWCVMGKPRKDE